MARPFSEKRKRENTKDSLKNALLANGLSETFIMDKVEEYMSFYDDLCVLNRILTALKSSEDVNLKKYMDATAEKRRVSSEMRNILKFLGLKPEDANIQTGSDADEVL